LRDLARVAVELNGTAISVASIARTPSGLVRFSAVSLELASERAAHPIAALPTEWSLWVRGTEDNALPAARRLGIGIVPYSTLGRGFLTGAVRTVENMAADDVRRGDARMHGENLRGNLELLDRVRDLAADKDATPAQVALAWLLAQGEDVVPIPGTTQRSRLHENCGALDVTLTAADLQWLGDAVPVGSWAGERSTFRPDGTSRPL
jgi:aryl-alcohol dehydrogenase-like predicted oxidoreductase